MGGAGSAAQRHAATRLTGSAAPGFVASGAFATARRLHMSPFMSRAPKRALKVLARVSVCRRLLSIVRLIQSFISVNLLVSAAFREVTAAERFRRDFG